MHDLNGILINPSTPILRAVQIIDASPVKIALAVDAKQQLRGTITDGDVRRGLLRGISLKEPVSRIMNRKPRFATFGEDSVALARKMQKELISQMPIFDARGRLVGIEILEDFLKPKIYDNSVLIMAGGLGTPDLESSFFRSITKTRCSKSISVTARSGRSRSVILKRLKNWGRRERCGCCRK